MIEAILINFSSSQETRLKLMCRFTVTKYKYKLLDRITDENDNFLATNQQLLMSFADLLFEKLI